MLSSAVLGREGASFSLLLLLLLNRCDNHFFPSILPSLDLGVSSGDPKEIFWTRKLDNLRV